MEPQIRYCTTADGVSIAYRVAGGGTPVISPASMNNLEIECGFEWHRILEARRRIVSFDARGGGSSQRDVHALSADDRALDIEAVADSLGLHQFVLHAEFFHVPTAIAYAARHPERVSHLVLLGGFARGDDVWQIPRARTLFSMLDQGDWEMFIDAMCLNTVGWELPEVARQLAHVHRSAHTLEQARAVYEGVHRSDVTSLLAGVRVPTLVMHPRGAAFPTLDLARRLAAGIPGAHFKVLESQAAWSDELEPQLLDALDEFIGDGGREGAQHVQPQARRVVRKTPGLATILFTDIVGHTEMMQRLGDAKGRDVLREHERITRDLLKQHGGAEVKTMGDGFMASFVSVTSAIDCAIALQRAFATHTESMPEPLHVRVGLNAGEPIEEDGDLFGATVILASRIAAKAGAGEILVPDTVRGLLSGKGFVFGDRGEFVPKGFDEGVRLWDVRWRD
jgi:class 3 adenylate cyclase